MSISGNLVHGEIKGKIREIESESEHAASQLYKIEQDITVLTVEREDHYCSLAAHYLPELDAEAVRFTLREIREDVERVFREKQERRIDLEKLMKENRKKNCRLEEEIDATTTQIEQQAQERDKTVKAIAEDLQKDGKYTQMDEEAKKAEARLQQNNQRISEVEEEARRKLPAFEQNKLFSYLLRTGYGTFQYEGSGLRKRLDSWAAGKVNFTENKKCYDFLKSMPEMMKQEVARRQEELDRIVSDLKRIESRTEKQQGLPEIVARAEKLMTQRQDLIEKDKKQDEQHASYAREREEIDSKKDPYHVRAIEKIKTFLKGEQIADLKSRAKQTEGTEDDKIADRIGYIDLEIRELKDKAKGVRAERDVLATKLDDVRKIEKRFRERDYEGSYSSFSDGFNVTHLLVAYMLGTMSKSDIDRKIDSSQSTRTPRYHSSSDYSSSDRSSGSSSHSSSSFGSFSSGGGFGGGGGFSSGHGF